MKTIKFLQESFETKERFQQEISFKYSYNLDIVESIDFRINQHNIKNFYEAMQNFENSLVDEFKEKKTNFRIIFTETKICVHVSNYYKKNFIKVINAF